MELRQLRYLAAVVDHDGFRRAGAALRVAPSALSRSVRQLEQHLGVELLDRTGTGVQLTAAGREFLRQTRGVVAAADAAASSVREHARGLVSLRVGAVAGSLAAGELTLPLMRAFTDACPGVRLYTETLPFTDQLGALVRGEVDAAIVRTPVSDPAVDLSVIALEPRVLLVSRDSDLAQEDSVGVEDVLHLTTVRLESPPGWSSWWQLDPERGHDRSEPSLPVATNVQEFQAAVGTGRAVVTTAASCARFAPSTRTRSVRLTGASLSPIAVAVRRGEDRRHVLRFVQTAQATAERDIDLLAGARLP